MTNTNPRGMRRSQRAAGRGLEEIVQPGSATALRAQVFLSLSEDRGRDPAKTRVCVAPEEMILTGTVHDMRAFRQALETGSEISLEHVVLAPLRAVPHPRSA